MTATLFTMYLNGATPPWNNKVMFYTNKCMDVRDTLRIQSISALSDKDIIAVTKFQLEQNYPNPFNPVTTIKFSIPRNTRVVLEIFNVLGQKVRTLISTDLTRGQHLAKWNGKNDKGTLLSSGLYFYRIRADNFINTKKMIIIK